MNAIHFTQFKGPLSVIDIAMPLASDAGVVIKVEATGVCRSDWHGWMGHDTDIALPHVPGHELAGVISSVGSLVSKFKVGDRVTVPFVCGCGQCEFCLRGDGQVCPTQSQPGFTGFGSFAEYVAIENADFNLVSIPDSISFSTAAALGCRFATAYRGLVKRAKVLAGETVIVYGCGGVGLSAIMIARALGAKVWAVDVSEEALKFLDKITLNDGLIGLGVINPNEADPVGFIQFLGGADIAIDALGSQETANQAVMSLKRGGRHLQLGLLLTPDGKTSMPMSRVIGWELSLLGSHGMAAADYPEMLALVASGVLDPSRLIKFELNLEEGAKALQYFDSYSRGGITIIKPGK